MKKKYSITILFSAFLLTSMWVQNFSMPNMHMDTADDTHCDLCFETNVNSDSIAVFNPSKTPKSTHHFRKNNIISGTIYRTLKIPLINLPPGRLTFLKSVVIKE